LGLATQDKKIGIVGAKLLFPNNPDYNFSTFPPTWKHDGAKIQHAGVAILKGSPPMHIYKNMSPNTVQTVFVRPFPTVTFALVLVNGELVDKMQFDEALDCDLNDIDYCLEARKIGYEIMFHPHAQAIHLESASRQQEGLCGKKENYDYFFKKWADELSRSGLEVHEVNKLVRTEYYI